jgi:hypothetical protein
MQLRAWLNWGTAAVFLATQQLKCAADPFDGEPAAAAPCYTQTRACDTDAACRACTIVVNKPAGGAPADPVTCEKLLEFVSNTFPECDPSRTPAYNDLLNCFVEAMAVSVRVDCGDAARKAALARQGPPVRKSAAVQGRCGKAAVHSHGLLVVGVTVLLQLFAAG